MTGERSKLCLGVPVLVSEFFSEGKEGVAHILVSLYLWAGLDQCVNTQRLMSEKPAWFPLLKLKSPKA